VDPLRRQARVRLPHRRPRSDESVAARRPFHSIEMPALFQITWMIVGMLVPGGIGIIIRLVAAGDPGAEVDQLASLGAKRAKAIRRRHVSRFFAIWTGGHRNSTRESSYDQNCKWRRAAQMRSARSVAHPSPRYARPRVPVTPRSATAWNCARYIMPRLTKTLPLGPMRTQLTSVR